MNTYYATTFESTHILGEKIKAHCQCGESYAFQIDENNKVIICNSCTETVSNYERFYIRINEN